MANWFRQGANGGNLSAYTQWYNAPSGGSAMTSWSPTASDVFYANAKTGILIDGSFSCSKLSNKAENGAAGGGYFYYTGRNAAGELIVGTVTVTGHIQAGTGGHGLLISGADVTAANPLVIIGNVTGGTSSNCPGISCSANATVLTITGDVTGGTTTNCQGISNSGSSAIITINGNVTSGTNTHGIINTGGTAVRITISGNATATGLHGVYNYNGANATIQIGGMCQGTLTGMDNNGLRSTGANCTITLNHVLGGSGVGMAAGAYLIGSGTVLTVLGDVTGGNYSAFGVNLGIATATIYGTVTAGLDNGSVGVNASTTLCIIYGNLIDSLTCGACAGKVRLAHTAANYHQMYRPDDTAVKYPPQLDAGDVRRGVVHGDIVGRVDQASAFRRLNRFV